MVLRPGCRLYVPPGGLLVDSSRPREFPVTVEASLGPICYGARTSGRGHWGKDTARRRSLEGRDRASRGPRDTPLRSPRSSPLPDVRSTRSIRSFEGSPGSRAPISLRAGAARGAVLFAAADLLFQRQRAAVCAVTRLGQHRGPLLRHDCGPPTHWYRAQTMNSPVA